MKVPTVESSVRAGGVYAVLRMVLSSVGLSDNLLLSEFIKYVSLSIAIIDLFQEELSMAKPYIFQYAKDLLVSFKSKNDLLYEKRIISLCHKEHSTIPEHQEKILNKICNGYCSNNHTEGFLFNQSQDNLKAICIILGDQELCPEVL